MWKPLGMLIHQGPSFPRTTVAVRGNFAVNPHILVSTSDLALHVAGAIHLLRVISDELETVNLVASGPIIRGLLRGLTLVNPQAGALGLGGLENSVPNLVHVGFLSGTIGTEVPERGELNRGVRGTERHRVTLDAQFLFLNRFGSGGCDVVVSRVDTARRINTSLKLRNSRMQRVSGLSGQNGDLSVAVCK